MSTLHKTAVVTDSNSGITPEIASELRARGQAVFVLPMPIIIDGQTFFEGVDISQAEFFARLEAGASVRTSQPAPAEVTDLWDQLLTEYDQIVHIPMSSGLSHACETAVMLANDYAGRVQVVNNHRISVTQRQSVMDALTLVANGSSAEQIRQHLERVRLESSIYIMVDELKYLVAGGRLTPAAATFARILRIKPVLQIQGERLDAYAKALGITQARKTMLKAMRSDIDKRFDGRCNVFFAYTHDLAAGQQFRDEACQELGLNPNQCWLDPLALSVSCHIGPGAIAIACSKRIEL